jgi:hypothetical protein
MCGILLRPLERPEFLDKIHISWDYAVHLDRRTDSALLNTIHYTVYMRMSAYILWKCHISPFIRDAFVVHLTSNIFLPRHNSALIFSHTYKHSVLYSESTCTEPQVERWPLHLLEQTKLIGKIQSRYSSKETRSSRKLKVRSKFNLG